MATLSLPPAWDDARSKVLETVEEQSSRCLDAYRVHPDLVLEHANLERAAASGGYGKAQLFELIQNGADELVDTQGRISVVLTPDALYCANEGEPITPEGVRA